MSATDSTRTAETDAHTTPSPEDGDSRETRAVWIVAGSLFVGLTLAYFMWSGGDVGETDRPLNRVARVPAFSLTERDGQTVTLEDFAGKVWLADFIFTSCSGPCPVLSLRMRSLQGDIAAFGGSVKLVSFSIDPTFDQPPVLRRYADRHHADPNLWWFLTCNDEAAMHTLVREGFLQAVSPAQGGGTIIHSTQFVLIDREGYIRGWYDGTKAASKPLILRDIQRLLAEPAA